MYSLGSILYEILSGYKPFIADSLGELLRKVAEEEPLGPRHLNSQVPRNLETVCLKALEKEPGRRYESAHAFSRDLTRYLNGEPVLPKPIALFTKSVKKI